MKKLWIPLCLLFLIFIAISIPSSQAFQYNSYFYHNETGNTANVVIPSFYSKQYSSCRIFLNTFADFENTGSFTADINYYSPNYTLIGSGHLEKSGNQDCLDFSYASTNANLNKNLEGRSILTHTATKGINYLRSKLSCDISGDWINITSNNSMRDSNNNVPNVYYYLDNTGYQSASVMGSYLDSDSFTSCVDIKANLYNSLQLAGGTGFNTVTFYYVFNSSNGNLRYNLDGSSVFSGGSFTINNAIWIIYPLSDSSSPSTLCSSDSCSGNIAIDYDTIYILGFLAQVNDQVGATNINAPIMNLDINIYSPAWVCSDYGECISGTRSRTCVDPLGKLPNRLEYLVCFALPDETLVIGDFEETRNDIRVWYSYPDWWLVTCPFNLGLKNVTLPIYWAMNYEKNPPVANNGTFYETGVGGLLFDLIRVTTEKSYAGASSLKMWNIPPSQYIPICNDGSFPAIFGTCELTPYGNYTLGQFVEIRRDINESYLLSRNLTFDYPNMTLSLAGSKCGIPEVQYSGNDSFLGLCGVGYYTNNKQIRDIEDTPVFFRIWDYNDSTVIFYEIDTIDTEAWQIKEFQMENLTTDHLYRFEIGIIPTDSVFDTRSYCAYIDDIKLNAFTSAIPCESYCVGALYYEAEEVESLLGQQICSFTVRPLDLRCLAPKFADIILNCEDFCICDSDNVDYLTFFQGSNTTGECQYIDFDNSPYCQELCEEEGELITPFDELLGDLADRGINIPPPFDKLFNPLFIIIIVVVIVISVIAWWTGTWQIGLIAGFLLLIALAMIYPQLAWIVIIFIVIAGLLFAKEMKGMATR